MVISKKDLVCPQFYPRGDDTSNQVGSCLLHDLLAEHHCPMGIKQGIGVSRDTTIHGTGPKAPHDLPDPLFGDAGCQLQFQW